MMEKLKSWKNKIFENDKFYISLIFLLIATLLVIWFKDGKVIASGEDGPFLINPEKALKVFSNIWIENGTGFATTDFLPRITFAYFIYFLNFFGVPTFVIQMLTFLILMFTGCLSVYKLSLNFFKLTENREFISFFASIFYLFNPYSLTQIWNRQLYSQYFLFALFPLLLLFFIKGLTEKKYINIIYFTFTSLFFSSAFGLITNLLVIWSVILLYLVYFIFTNKEKTIFAISYFLILVISWLIGNSWWLAPFIVNLTGENVFSSKTNPFENIGILRSLSRNFDILMISRLMQDNYFFRDLNLKDFYSNIYLQVFSFIAPVLILFNIKKIFQDKKARFLLITFFIGLFVSLGSNYPFGFIFEFFFNKFLFLQAFRNSYEKYGIVFMFSYIIILGYSLNFFLKNYYKKFLLIFFVSIWFYYLSPLIVGQRIQVTQINNPLFLKNTSLKLDELVENDRNFKITALPITGEGISTDWGYGGVDPYLYLFDYPFISYRVNTPIQLDILNKLNEKIVNGERYDNLLSLLNSKYIYLKNDLVSEEKYDEINLTKKRVLDYEKIEDINCKSVQYEKNLIENKKVISCVMDNYKLDKNFLVKVTTPYDFSPIELDIIDNIGNRSIWIDPDKHLNTNLSTTFMIYSERAHEKSRELNYGKVKNLNLVVDKNIDIENLNLQSIKFYKTPYKYVENDIRFNKLFTNEGSSLYELVNFKKPLFFGYINSLSTVRSIDSLIEETKIDNLEKNSYIVETQNKNKYFNSKEVNYQNPAVSGIKIDNQKYFLPNNKSESGVVNIQLLNTYNSQWVLLDNTKFKDLEDGFLNSYRLLLKTMHPDKSINHLISNGYGNLWQVNNPENQDGYAVIFLPQIYKDFFGNISILFYIILSIFVFLHIIKTELPIGKLIKRRR